MLNFYKDLLLKEKVLFIVTLVLGIFLRCHSLAEVSSWSDEIASWYFAHNLDTIFKQESHTPLYYFICRVWFYIASDTVLYLRLLSIFLSYLILFVSINILKDAHKYLLLSFSVLWSLFPTLIIYDRQARHYGLFLELIFFVVLIWNNRKNFNSYLLWFLFNIIHFIHPLSLVPVCFLLTFDFVQKQIPLRKYMFLLSSIVPVLGYYGVRVFTFGGSAVTANVSWIRNDSLGFFKSLVLLFAGDSFPLTFVYPLDPNVVIGSTFLFIMLLISFDGLRIFKNLNFYKFLILFLVTLVIVELLAYLGLNLRIGRYFIYLVPFFLYFVMEIFLRVSNKFLLLSLIALMLSFYNLFFLKPWRVYFWEDQSVGLFKSTYPNFENDENLIICGNIHQLDYYFHRKLDDCSSEAFNRFYSKRDFNLFDISGSHSTKALSLYLSNLGNVYDRKFYGNSFFFRFKIRD